MLGGAPGVYDGDLMDAGDGAVGGAGFFGVELAADIGNRIFFQRCAGIAALLRAVVD